MDNATVDRVADSLATRDVVFLGELHDNDAGHAVHHRLVRALEARRSDIVLSMEMFERDEQPALDDYLAGRTTEAEFLEAANVWANYEPHYRPFIEWAKAHSVPVVAANLPRTLAKRVRTEGLDVLENEAHAPDQVLIREGAYWDAFCETMRKHGQEAGATMSEDELRTYFRAQSAWDDTMAESILAARLMAPRVSSSPPLVVHVCGAFHSAKGLGTVAKLLDRDPKLEIGILTMDTRAKGGVVLSRPTRVVSEPSNLEVTEWMLYVPEQPGSDEASEEAVDATEAGAVAGGQAIGEATEASPHSEASSHAEMPDEHGEGGGAPSQPASKAASMPSTGSAPSEHASAASKPGTRQVGNPDDGRPALGLMPAYESEGDGLGVEMVTMGGHAEAAGVEGGDTIIELDGQEVVDIQSYMTALSNLTIGETVDVIVIRGLEQKKLRVKVGSR